ncbi:MAG: hypothetical protein ABUL72_03220 [Armatimonadota bacterium]
MTPDGIYKEKLSEPWPEGIRFSGQVFRLDGTTYNDRTTLTKLKDGTVRQVIEASRDGKTWKPLYDAVYSRIG